MDIKTAPVEIPTIQNERKFRLSMLLVEDGQEVQAGQPLARLEGQNESALNQELISPLNGYVVGLRATTGQVVQAEQILCYICSRPAIPAGSAEPAIEQPLRASFDPTALIIFGGGGHGRSVIDLVRAMGTYRLAGVIDDQLPRGSDVLGVPVLGGARDLKAVYSQGIQFAANAVGGIGNVALRLKIFDLLENAGFAFPALIHPSAVIERSAVIEGGVQILPQAYVGSAARIGFGTVLNAGAIVSHDCVVGRVVNLSPGATLAGNVRVENHAQIGMRATVNMQITVGAGALLGNGCTVKADVPPGTRVCAGTIWPIRTPRPAE